MFSPRFSTQLLAGTAIALVLNAPEFAAAAEPAEQQVAAADQTAAAKPESRQMPTITVEGRAPSDFKADNSDLSIF